MKKFEYYDRSCDCCGSRKTEELFSYTTSSRTKSESYIWNVRAVICQECGFVFVSPCPTDASLIEYYSDSYEYWRELPLDFELDTRLEIISRYVPRDRSASFVEVGGNNSQKFHSAIAPLVASYANVEVNQHCENAVSSMRSLVDDSADVVSAYFVLEHVAAPRDFLRSIATLLKVGGALIVEVPNVFKYPFDQAGLAWWEHVSHFSPFTLGYLAAGEGLELVEVSNRWCSRSFGFTAVFIKQPAPSSVKSITGRSEYLYAKSCVMDGFAKIRRYHNRLDEVRGTIERTRQGGKKVVVWGANRVCYQLLDLIELKDEVIVVDSDPQKRNYLGSIEVSQPDDVSGFIKRSGLFVVCSEFFSKSIITSLETILERELKEDEFLIVSQDMT